jgi:hypothetical protein
VALVHASKKLGEPSSFEEAYEKEWEDVMIEEFNPILQNDVWEIVLRPMGKSVIDSR